MPRSPENIFVVMLALLAFASPAQAELINHTYWAYIPNPPLLQVVKWTEREPIVSTNDSIHTPSLWSIKGPSQAEEEGKLINISQGYEVLPFCQGPAELCINVSRQTCAFGLPPKEDYRTLLGLFTALSLYVNHDYTAEALGKQLGKEQRTLCKGFTYKNFTYTPVLWDKMASQIRKINVCGYSYDCQLGTPWYVVI